MQKMICVCEGMKPSNNRCHKTNGYPKRIHLQGEIGTKHLLTYERNHWMPYNLIGTVNWEISEYELVIEWKSPGGCNNRGILILLQVFCSGILTKNPEKAHLVRMKTKNLLPDQAKCQSAGGRIEPEKTCKNPCQLENGNSTQLQFPCLFWFVKATITKYHRLGGISKIK